MSLEDICAVSQVAVVAANRFYVPLNHQHTVLAEYCQSLVFHQRQVSDYLSSILFFFIDFFYFLFQTNEVIC